MLKLALISILVAPMIAFGATKEIPIKVLCNDDGEFLTQLRDEYKEQPIIVGQAGDGLTMSLLTNIEKDTWSLISIQGNVVCVLMVGRNLKVLPYKKTRPNM